MEYRLNIRDHVVSCFFKAENRGEEKREIRCCCIMFLQIRKWTSMIREKEKDRLTPIVEALSTTYLGPDYSQPEEYADISLKDIDQIAKSSFPFCMRHLLREDHLLKHGGRMQLGLFLKGVGLKLEDALAFWKAEFSRKVAPLAAYYQVPLRHILLVYDEMSLPNGVLRLQPKGGHGHHNGYCL